MKALLILLLIVVCQSHSMGQQHPYGERSGLPTWPHTFGEKLHYLCSCRSTMYEPESTWRVNILAECDANYDIILKIQNLAPSDRYLARLLGYVADSNLPDARKKERFSDAMRHFGKPEWLGTTNQILNLRPDVLKKHDIQAVLAAGGSDDPKSKSNRLVAQRLLAKLAIEERMKPNVPEGSPPTDRTASVRGSGRSTPNVAANRWKWGLIAGISLVLAAAAFYGCRQWAKWTFRE